MAEPIKPDDIDAVIHERVRLVDRGGAGRVAAVELRRVEVDARADRRQLKRHSRTLEEAGYIVVEKSFRGRRPYTAMRLTPKGRKAFERYLETLRQIVDHGDQAAGDSS